MHLQLSLGEGCVVRLLSLLWLHSRFSGSRPTQCKSLPWKWGHPHLLPWRGPAGSRPGGVRLGALDLLAAFSAELSIALRGSISSGSDFSLCCGTGLWGRALPGFPAALSCLPAAGAAAGGGGWDLGVSESSFMMGQKDQAHSSVLCQDQTIMVCLPCSAHRQGLLGPWTCRKDTFSLSSFFCTPKIAKTLISGKKSFYF